MSFLSLEYYLKELRLPTFLKEYKKVAEDCKNKNEDYETFLMSLSEREVLQRQSRAIEQRIKKAQFPMMKTLETFQFDKLPSLNKNAVLEFAKGEYVEKGENIIALGNSGTGKTHLAIALGYAACQQGKSVYFVQAAHLVHLLLEAKQEKDLLRLKKKLLDYDILIIDELGFVPFSKTGAELLFEIFSNRYEQGSMLITSNLPFEEWTQIFGSDRLTAALLDRLTHHVHILEMNGDSYRLSHAKQRKKMEEKNMQ